jgi:hypothetical protein
LLTSGFQRRFPQLSCYIYNWDIFLVIHKNKNNPNLNNFLT